MDRFVVLFRGINVGKARRIAMADLRGLLVSLGFSNVTTLLNSGNAVFDGPSASPAKHAQRIKAAVANDLGVDAPVMVKSAGDIAAIVAFNPLLSIAIDPSRLLVALGRDADALRAFVPIVDKDAGPDEFHVGANAIFVWCANGILESTVAATLLKGLGESITTRNWSTIQKIHAAMNSGNGVP